VNKADVAATPGGDHLEGSPPALVRCGPPMLQPIQLGMREGDAAIDDLAPLRSLGTPLDDEVAAHGLPGAARSDGWAPQKIRPTFVKSLPIRVIMSTVVRFRFQMVAQRSGSAKSIMMMFGMNDFALRPTAAGGYPFLCHCRC
jgi:hypothetical protein